MNGFYREGEYWTLVFNGEVARLRASRGLLLLSRLLERSGREVHVLDLAELRGVDADRAESVLDTTARRVFRDRIVELEADLNEADLFGDIERSARARAELDAVVDELARATGLGGRDRQTASDSERARVAATRAIRSALERISQALPDLGRHLRHSVRTGTYCVYAPDPMHPIGWQLTAPTLETATLNPGTTVTKTHSSGAAVYQQLITDRAVYADRGEFGTNYTTLPAADRTYGGTFSAIGAVSTTLASSASPGNTTIQLAAAISSPTLVIDTAGAAETVTVVNVFGAGAPYTYYLAAPLAQSHSSGVTVASGTGYSATSFGPRMVVADRVAANSPASVVAVGDSILAGSGYQLRLNTSYLELALGATNPVVNLGVPSDTAQAFAALANSPGRRKLLAAGNWLYVQYPHNDISSSRTLPQVQADLTTIVKLGRARGMRVALNTTPPRTTSSDGWATTTNQTFDANESVRLAYNAWVRAGAGGLADLVLDVAAPLDSGTATGGASTGLWRAAGSAGPYTVDGVHPSVVGHQAMAAAINSAWLS